jgi:hypothetical protein
MATVCTDLIILTNSNPYSSSPRRRGPMVRLGATPRKSFPPVKLLNRKVLNRLSVRALRVQACGTPPLLVVFPGVRMGPRLRACEGIQISAGGRLRSHRPRGGQRGCTVSKTGVPARAGGGKQPRSGAAGCSPSTRCAAAHAAAVRRPCARQRLWARTCRSTTQ